ncbi:MAG TPA: hypothetical protein VK787_01880 [Puia sp.]|jgi:hypothetical protein|nr:hypothetical protein [Puia sp.]
MSERFLKFIPSEEAMFLLKNKGHAFRLLTIIAECARRYENSPDGLKIGEAFIGGHAKYDMTEQNYRTAKILLVERGHISIIETNRTRKGRVTTDQRNPNGKVTTVVTTEGTKVKLLSSNVWDLNIDVGNDRTNVRVTTDQRLPNDKLRNKEYKESKENKNIAQTAKSPLRSRADCLFFDFDKGQYMGITDIDLAQWKEIYPHIEIQSEIIKSINWLKSNPSKSKKSLWRKFLTGWLGRANDTIENKKAFRAASGSNAIDRKTKNKDGTPIASRAEELF